MYCRKCGNELLENAAFCGKCGVPTNQKVGGAGELDKKRKDSGKKGCIAMGVAGVVLTGIILAVVIGVTKRSVMDEIKTNVMTVDSSMKELQEEMQVVTTKNMNPADYQWIMTRTDTCDGENNFLGCSTYAYSATNKQVKWEMFNADYSLNTREEYTYDDLDRIIQSQTWDGNGNRIKNSDRIYEGDFTQPEKVVWYKEDGSIQYSNRYGYHPEYDKVDIVWEYNADGEEVNYKEFSFDEDGNYTGYRYCYPDGSLYETCAYTYDEAGNMVATEKFDKDNEIKETNSYQYIDGNEVSYQKWNGEEELLVWNTMEYDHAGNEIIRYYYNADRELLNTVLSTYEPVWDCNAVSVEPENGEYLFESQSPIEEFCLWFGQEKSNIVNEDGMIVETENERFPITACITINETDACSVEITSVMEKLSFEEGITVNSIKLEILDEAGNTVSDERLLPNMYLFGTSEEVTEVEGDTEAELEEQQYYLATKSIYYNNFSRNGLVKEIYEYDSAGILSSHTGYSENERVRLEEEYNDAGNIISYISYEGSGLADCREEWEYDREGKAISYISYSSDGSVEEIGEWEYDSSGNAIFYTSYYYRIGGEVKYNVNWEYDDNGNVIRETSLGGHGETTTLEYDSFGNVIHKDTFFEYGHISNSTVQMEYDNYGNKVSEKKSFPDNPINDSQKKWAWEYDDNGNKTKCISYSESGSIESIETWEYDGNGNVIRNIHYHEDGSVETEIKREYDYDNNGNLLREEEHEYNESGKEKITEVFYEYRTL